MPRYGLNIDPDNSPFGTPNDPAILQGLGWVRLVIKTEIHPLPSIEEVCKVYAPLVDAYHGRGIGTLLIINHQTFAGNAPWGGSNDWDAYVPSYADTCARVAAFFKPGNNGKNLAYEIWNEQDQTKPVVPKDAYSKLVFLASKRIKEVDSKAKVVFGGLVSGDPKGYLDACRQPDGTLPVDIIGLHPYGKQPTNVDGKGIVEFLKPISAAYPNLPIWITEIGVFDTDTAQRLKDVAFYMDGINKALRNFLPKVEVLIWFCWSDAMSAAEGATFGITDSTGKPKDKVYAKFATLAGMNPTPLIAPLPGIRALIPNVLADISPEAADHVINIQWVSQMDKNGHGNNDCGDASVLMLLGFYDLPTPSREEVFNVLQGKTTFQQLIGLGKNFMLPLTAESASVERLPILIDAGKPVILPVEYKSLDFPLHLADEAHGGKGVDQGAHWFVCVGYDASGFFVHDPLWMPKDNHGQGGAFLHINTDTLQNALLTDNMLYKSD